MIGPKFVSVGGVAQGDHTNALNAGPPASAGIAMDFKPAAWAHVVAKLKMATRTSFVNRIYSLDRILGPDG
jgi:hypothetical protein